MFRKAGIFLYLREIVLSTVLLSSVIQFSKVEAGEDRFLIHTTGTANETQVPYTVGSGSGIVQSSVKGCRCLSECRQAGKPHSQQNPPYLFWCYVGEPCSRLVDWDYCEPHEGRDLASEAVGGILSTNGYPCKSECRRDGTDYYCVTIERRMLTRDYCSPLPGLDYRGKKCSTKCDHNGKIYTWCYLAEGGWGYCTKTKDERLTDTSDIIASHGNACANQCGREGNTKYYWCKTKTPYKGKDWDYCSRQAGHDYQGQKCSNSCGHHGHHYKWCNLVGGGWGYCSH